MKPGQTWKEELSFRDKTRNLSAWLVVFARSNRKPTEQEVGKRPLPLTSCENLGKSVEHPEAVDSSAKWTQKHLLCVLHGWWSERCEKTYAAEHRRARPRSPTSAEPPLWAELCCASARVRPRLSVAVSSSSASSSAGATRPRRPRAGGAQEGFSRLVPGRAVWAVTPTWMRQLLLICR